MMINDEKVRENRLRRVARRRGYCLTKSRLRDPRAIGYGLYKLVKASGTPVGHGWTIDRVEEFLDSP